MLIRVLLIGALGLAAWWLVRQFLAPRGGRDLQAGSRGEYRRMVACRQCGVHVPADEAINRNGASYCSRAHLPD